MGRRRRVRKGERDRDRGELEGIRRVEMKLVGGRMEVRGH